MLQTFGAIYKIDSDLLGLTVLAMGNSLGDMAANLAVVSMPTSRLLLSQAVTLLRPPTSVFERINWLLRRRLVVGTRTWR